MLLTRRHLYSSEHILKLVVAEWQCGDGRTSGGRGGISPSRHRRIFCTACSSSDNMLVE